MFKKVTGTHESKDEARDDMVDSRQRFKLYFDHLRGKKDEYKDIKESNNQEREEIKKQQKLAEQFKRLLSYRLSNQRDSSRILIAYMLSAPSTSMTATSIECMLLKGLSSRRPRVDPSGTCRRRVTATSSASRCARKTTLSIPSYRNTIARLNVVSRNRVL